MHIVWKDRASKKAPFPTFNAWFPHLIWIPNAKGSGIFTIFIKNIDWKLFSHFSFRHSNAFTIISFSQLTSSTSLNLSLPLRLFKSRTMDRWKFPHEISIRPQTHGSIVYPLETSDFVMRYPQIDQWILFCLIETTKASGTRSWVWSWRKRRPKANK